MERSEKKAPAAASAGAKNQAPTRRPAKGEIPIEELGQHGRYLEVMLRGVRLYGPTDAVSRLLARQEGERAALERALDALATKDAASVYAGAARRLRVAHVGEIHAHTPEIPLPEDPAEEGPMPSDLEPSSTFAAMPQNGGVS